MFCAVAKSGSLVAAAGKLHLTPSAISHGLKALETQLGCRLFDRAGKRILLNQAGEQLLAQVEQPLAALHDAEESLKRLGKWGHTRLRIGAAASVCQYLLPAVIRELKKSFASVTLQVESGDMAEMVARIHQNRIDLALGVDPDQTSGLEARSVFKDELLFVFAPSHPWAQARTISREDLRRQPLILYQRSSLTARMVDEYFRGLELVPSTVMEIGSIEAIKELVKLNLGVSVLAPWTADKELARGTLRMRALGTRPLRREWVIASLAGRRLSLVEETFCRLSRNVAAGLRMDRKDVPARAVS
jgi:DNA-binding transcriptional LysR family regulator